MTLFTMILFLLGVVLIDGVLGITAVRLVMDGEWRVGLFMIGVIFVGLSVLIAKVLV